MKKVINEDKIEFYSEETGKMLMCFGIIGCDYFWNFTDSSVITVTEDMELFEPIKTLMSYEYEFNEEEVLKCSKDNNSLVWYSDSYYNPDDKYDMMRISYLTIKRLKNSFEIKCTNPMKEEKNINYPFTVAFSPHGNGRYAENTTKGLTLQDDFVENFYIKLRNKRKVKELQL